MTRALVAAAVLLAACEPPPVTIKFRLTRGDTQQCIGDDGDVATSCQDVTMLCPAYVSLRILSPNDPEAPYVSLCQPLTSADDTLCAIASDADFTPPEMPIREQTLEVQIAVFPADAVLRDEATDTVVCPRVEYAANGLPRAALPSCTSADPFTCPTVPAVGGRAFYRPGDELTVVELGCSNLEQLTDPQVCNGVPLLDVTATVNDFDIPVTSVDRLVADRLDVGVGEPTPAGDTYVLNTSYVLERTASSSPTWADTISAQFDSFACLEVTEDVAETTTSLSCRRVTSDDSLDIPGYFLRKATLTQILSALGLSSFPASGGLVVGMVVDENFDPLPGAQVTCADCTVEYLSANRTSLVTGGTSASGIFVSRDATFGTEFAIIAPGAVPVIGGIVEGKVTIVVLQDEGSVVGGG